MQGVVVQRPSFPPGAAAKGAAGAAVTLREQAREFYAPLIPLVVGLHQRGLSLRGIALQLRARGIRTRQGGENWHARQVSRILERARKGKT